MILAVVGSAGDAGSEGGGAGSLLGGLA